MNQQTNTNLTEHTPEKVIIIGSGPAALAASLYTARSGLNPLVVEGKEPGGQLMWTNIIENWPGQISTTGPELIFTMRKQTQYFGTRFLSQQIVNVDFTQKPFMLTTHKQVNLYAHSVIIATGSVPKRLGCKGEDTYWGKGVGVCAVCDGAFYRNLPVIIVGGGNRAVENALFMTNFTDSITMIQLTDELTATQTLKDQTLRHRSIKIIYNSTLTEIKGDGTRATQAVVHNTLTEQKTTVEAYGIFVSIGSLPNTQPFINAIDLTPDGYILLADHTQTSCPGVFAAGDVADARYRQAITSAATGCMAALDTERYLQELL